MTRCAHTWARQGQGVVILLRSGERIVGRYRERKSGRIVLMDGRTVATGSLRAMTIARGPQK